MSPWLVEKLARMPVGVRLAMRDTARYRSRTGPIVMAIGAGLGLSVAAGAALESPRIRRSLAAARAGILTLLGGVLAVPAGLLPIWGLSAASGSGTAADLTVPGASILAAAVLVPAVAAGAAWLLTRPAAATL